MPEQLKRRNRKRTFGHAGRGLRARDSQLGNCALCSTLERRGFRSLQRSGDLAGIVTLGDDFGVQLIPAARLEASSPPPSATQPRGTRVSLPASQAPSPSATPPPPAAHRPSPAQERIWLDTAWPSRACSSRFGRTSPGSAGLCRAHVDHRGGPAQKQILITPTHSNGHYHLPGH